MDTFNDVNLRLSILEPDPSPQRGGLTKLPPDSGILTLRQGPLVGRSYRTVLQVCAIPTCPCCNIRFQCQFVQPAGSAQGGSWQEFWLDVWDRKIVETEECQAASEASELASAIQAELTDADWEQLYRWFRIAKLEVIHTTDIEEIELAELPETEGPRMVGFVDVFPWGHALDFPLEAEQWTVDEQYCVQPKCTCKETVLTFLRYADATGRKMIGRRDAPAVRYDYKSQAVTEPWPWPVKAPPREVLMEALQRAVPSLNQQLMFRHTILQSLYLRRTVSSLQKQLQAVAPLLDPARAPKVGRNDPCPCGSGKKFKHCCLRGKA